MVGLVIVSHSRALGEALVGLVRQIATSNFKVAVAGGVGDARQEFGTDALDIMDAIQSVFSSDGVVILMDLGSAVLSAQMALELLPPEISQKVRLCPGPVVEGAIAAGVQIGLGSDLETICREAQAALLPKQEHLGDEETQPAPAQEAGPAGSEVGGQSVTLTLTNQHGLHARPAARFVQTVGAFKADVRVTNLTNGKGPVSARSLNAVVTLGAVDGHQIRIDASGPQAAQVLGELQRLVEENFGEPAAGGAAAAVPGARPAITKPGAAKPGTAGLKSAALGAVAPVAVEPGALPAVAVSEGVAVGPFYRYEPPVPPIPQERADNPAAELAQLQQAIEITRQAIDQRRRRLGKILSPEDAAIFVAHLLILQDPELLQQVQAGIETQRWNAAYAWNAVLSKMADEYRTLDDEYMRQRAADVEDVRNQVLFALAGKSTATITLDHPIILYAQDITPTETSQLDMARVLAIITAGGGPTSHSAILARSLGIPAIAGAGPALERVRADTIVAVDGFNGAVWIDPSVEVRQRMEARRMEWLEQRQRLLRASKALAITRDGKRIEVAANIGSVADARLAVENGAEGVGLLRTEFLFLTRETPPTEDEQYAVLREIGREMGGRPVLVRTLDAGGDKEVPYANLPPEANPFLGVRAIRLCLHQPELFMPQLRAILRVAAEFSYRMMFPMIATVDEVRQARRWMQQAHEQLQAEDTAHAWPIETGIMVEIPSAALSSRLLAKEVDFFSIGTNDLTQYTLAAERGNPLLSNLSDALHPAVLRLIGEVAEAAHAEGKWVGICGELGGDPLATPILLGLGIDELSMNSAGIPRVKAIMSQIDSGEARALAEKVLRLEDAPAVRQLAREFAGQLPKV